MFFGTEFHSEQSEEFLVSLNIVFQKSISTSLQLPAAITRSVHRFEPEHCALRNGRQNKLDAIAIAGPFDRLHFP
jgi:hypothetical protein